VGQVGRTGDALPRKVALRDAADDDYDGPMITPPVAERALASLLISLSVAACAAAAQPVASAPPIALAVQASAPSAPTAPAPPPPPATASDVLARGRAPFDACYTLARKTSSNLVHTSVEMTFTVEDDGKVLGVDLAYRNRMDDPAKACMRTAAEALAFPPSLHGKQTGTIVFTPP